MRSTAETRQLFDQWASSYDHDVAVAAGPLHGYTGSLAQAAVLVPVAAGDLMLDLGIGTGSFAALLAERGAIITGLDPSVAMLAQCQNHFPQFQLAVGGFGPLPFAPGRFAAVVSSFAGHEVPPAERLAAWCEVGRVLRPGGTFTLLDILFASPQALVQARTQYAATWDPTEHYALVGELDEQLRTAGFTPLRWQQTAALHWVVVARWGDATG